MKTFLIIFLFASFSTAWAKEQSITAKALVTAKVINPISLNKTFLEHHKNALINKTIYIENGISKIIINFE